MTSAALDPQVGPLRDASRRLVREFGFMQDTLAGTDLPASAVHALIEIGARGSVRAADLCDILVLEKSSVSRMLRRLVASGDVAEGASEQDGRAKLLSLTEKGRRTLAEIDGFAQRQVTSALERLDPDARHTVRTGLSSYADALTAVRTGTSPASTRQIDIVAGYRPGAIGRCAEMHGRIYARIAGFGRPFEAKVAAGLAEFAGRLDNPRNALWLAVQAGTIVGTVAIDGEDLGPGIAHLRWFIVDDGLRGGGVGRRLLAEAVRFCDRQGFAETQLWTFRGLDAARHLYEQVGFSLAEEWLGRQWGEEVMEQRFTRKASA